MMASQTPPALAWPIAQITAEEVLVAAQQAVGNAFKILGPTEIFAKNSDGPDQRLTAAYATDNADVPSVIVKINLFPHLGGSLAGHLAVARAAKGLVPKVLGFTEVPGGSVLVLSRFEGRLVDILGSSALMETARSLARIQQAVSKGPEPEGLPQLPLDQFVELHAQCVARLSEHAAFWQADPGNKLKKALGFPATEALEVLSGFAPLVESWVKTLSQSAIPLSIDHRDCHAGNAVRHADGSYLIFDWESAAWGHPFLSAEKLIVSAWALDEGIEGGPWGYERKTASQDTLRDAYLGVFGTSGELRAEFEAAMGLAVIREMHHEMEWALLCGWENLNPEWTAQLIRRLREHTA